MENGKRNIKDTVGRELIRTFIRSTLSEHFYNLSNIAKDKLFYTVSLHMIVHCVNDVIHDYFNNINPIAVYDDYRHPVVNYEIDTTGGSRQTPSLYIYKGTPIILIQRYLSEALYNDSGYVCGQTQNPSYFMSTLRTKKHIRNLREFINKLVKDGMHVADTKWKNATYMFNGMHFRRSSLIKRRSFDTVFIREEDKSLLISSVDKFVNSKEWYKKHSIPYHFGIMLYGQPGTGKTSIAQAIADHLDTQLYVVKGDDILRLPDSLGADELNIRSKVVVMLIEDIDCGLNFELLNRDSLKLSDDETRPKGMAALLNALDGINSPENIVYVFTTNHIEKLDPALIRPGRIDLKIDIKGVNKETFDQFTMRHFGQTVDKEIDFPSDLTFAALQTYVMKGMSLNEIINKIGGNDNEKIN